MTPPSFEIQTLRLAPSKKLFFASDFHLGAPDVATSHARERHLVRWLQSIQPEAQHVFLVGDLFDFWFEYKYVVPKGFVRLLGQLAAMADTGVAFTIFSGNHDMWMADYLHQELGATIRRTPVRYQVQTDQGEVSLLVGHGDGLGPGDTTYKFLKTFFENPLARWMFRQVHPDLGGRLAHAWSKHSRAANIQKGEERFKGEANEWLYQYCLEVEARQPHDYYVFGHRHLALDLRVSPTSRYINLGEWLTQYHYAILEGRDLSLIHYPPNP